MAPSGGTARSRVSGVGGSTTGCGAMAAVLPVAVADAVAGVAAGLAVGIGAAAVAPAADSMTAVAGAGRDWSVAQDTLTANSAARPAPIASAFLPTTVMPSVG